jgi:hypothetical protein
MMEQHRLSIHDRLDVTVSAGRAWFDPRFRSHALGRHVSKRTALCASACALFLLCVSAIATLAVEPILLILLAFLALKLAFVGAILTLAVRLHRRTAANNHRSSWRRGVKTIGRIALVVIVGYGVLCLRSGTLVVPLFLLGPLAEVGVVAVILIALYAAVTALSAWAF